MKAVITGTAWASYRAKAIRLAGEQGNALPPAPTGSHIKISRPGEDYAAPFSLTAPTVTEPGYEVIVTPGTEPDGVSRWLIHAGAKGSEVEITSPRCGLPWPGKAEHHVLIAGGSGLTALLARLAGLREAGASYELHYAVRARSEAMRLEDLHVGHPGKVRLYSAEEGERLDVPGLVSRAPEGSQVSVCGPPKLVQEVADESYRAGWPREAVQWDRFGWQPAVPECWSSQEPVGPLRA